MRASISSGKGWTRRRKSASEENGAHLCSRRMASLVRSVRPLTWRRGTRMERPKSEGRNPKEGRSPKSEEADELDSEDLELSTLNSESDPSPRPSPLLKGRGGTIQRVSDSKFSVS